MVEWLEQLSQWHEMYYHDLEVMSRALLIMVLSYEKPKGKCVIVKVKRRSH